MTSNNEDSNVVLVGAIEKAFNNSYVPNIIGTSDTPKQYSNIKELRKHLGNSDEVSRQSTNLVKKCGNCGKVNAISLLNCNSCGTQLPKETSTTDNILFQFVHGIGFKLSIRLQKKDVVVYDDLLCMSRCHINAIPTDVYVPDVRVLFNNPVKGLKLIKKLKTACMNAIKPFRKNDKFMRKTFGDRYEEAKKLSPDSFVNTFVICGFNCPPSQYHLHLQFIMLPHVPWHQHLYNTGAHYTNKRFLPYNFVENALKKGVKPKTPWDISTPMEDVFAFFEKNKLKYDQIYAKEYEKVKAVFDSCNTWKEEDFTHKYFPKDNTVIKVGKLQDPVEDEIANLKEGEDLAKEIVKGDSNVLACYGKGKRIATDGKSNPNLYHYKKAKLKLLPEFQT